MNQVTATFNSCGYSSTAPLYQYDYGQKLVFYGFDLPTAFEVHFSNGLDEDTTTQIGADNTVDIPDAYLLTGKNITAWLYLHTGNDDGETTYFIEIPVTERAKPSNLEPTPVQQDAITQAIAALNAGVEAAEQSATESAESAAAALASEQAAKASEEATALSETNAAASATAAANSASASAASASASADSARDSAESASASAASAADSYRDAERAEQAANNAGYLDIEIVDGNLIYTRTDAVDVDFVLDNGHLIMEVI